jgi:hypothetical protein
MTIPAMLTGRSEPDGAVFGLLRELRGNRRAQTGLLVITVLVCGYGLAMLRTATARVEASEQRAAATLARIAGIEQEKDWHQRAAASTALLATLDRRLWVAESEGLAQANVQAWISGVGRDIGLPMFDIRVEAAKPQNLPAYLRQITATITAQPSEAAVISLLERLQQAPYLTVVARLHVRQQPSPMLELVVVGYARITGTEAGGGAK